MKLSAMFGAESVRKRQRTQHFLDEGGDDFEPKSRTTGNSQPMMRE